MPHYAATPNKAHHQKQHGVVLIVMLVIIVMGAAALLVSTLNSSSVQVERDKKTAAVLVQAKESLIGFAAKVELSKNDLTCADQVHNFANPNCPRPGDLPCPDMDNDGDAEVNCGDAVGSNQYKRLGRLPWKTLGLPDLRDGHGERLWYAVSNNFKNSTRTRCSNLNQGGCLNSDTPGTISIMTADGRLLNDATNNTGVVAVIFAPAAPLQRQGAATVQNRGCTVGVDCDNTDKCTADPVTDTPKCDPVNYLDTVAADYFGMGSAAQDNANFEDGSAANGFIQGVIKDKVDPRIIILNDQLLTITQENIMQPVQKRVAAEIKNCLAEYAGLPQNQSATVGYYPFAAMRSLSAGKVVFNDSDQKRLGHIPDEPFAQTCSDTGGSNCNGAQSGGMKNSWGTMCSLNNVNWWVNWKEMVFYGFARNFRPHNLAHTHTCLNSPCLTVDPPSSNADKPFVIAVAGKKLAGQLRNNDANKNNPANYLEAPDPTNYMDANIVAPLSFTQSASSTIFNDVVTFP